MKRQRINSKYKLPTFIPSIPWTSSYWVVILVALLIGMLTILLSLTVDWVLHHEVRPLYASDFLEGVLAAILSGVALLRIQSRHRELLVRMQIVEDVNHHVRNALTGIVLSASLREDPDLNAQVREACARIDWVLSDVLSQSVHGNGHDGENPKWGSGRRL